MTNSISSPPVAVVFGRKIEDVLADYFLSLHVREQLSLIGTSEYNGSLVPKYVIEITENSHISKTKQISDYISGPNSFGAPRQQILGRAFVHSSISIMAISDTLFEITFQLPQEQEPRFLTNTRIYSTDQFDACVSTIKELMFALIVEQPQGPARFAQVDVRNDDRPRVSPRRSRGGF